MSGPTDSSSNKAELAFEAWWASSINDDIVAVLSSKQMAKLAWHSAVLHTVNNLMPGGRLP